MDKGFLMSKKTVAQIKEAPLADILGEKYLSYALSTIMSRSLPDVRDGLKPVHRRLLYAMHLLKLNSHLGYKKCARVVGDVIGRFHPHGETAVYDALVRLAQDFSVRYPLIDGQGNFGNIDGDNAAAMRYTESKLTPIAELLLEDLHVETIDFQNTYDNEDHEPKILPANFPNLIANGASGIAVGMATNIPPHNIVEICDALLKLIKKPDLTTLDLLSFVRGPDFPTGGILVEDKDSLIKAYETGRGFFQLRAKWEVESLKNGQWQIVITQIPFQVQKSKLIEKIAQLLQQKKITLLSDIRDESAEDIRLVLVPKSRNVDPNILMEMLYKYSDLETRVGLNMNVLDVDKTPRVMSLKDVLQAYLNHRHNMLVRRSNYRLSELLRRLEILQGYLIIFDSLDRVIQIIREEDKPKQVLMNVFSLSEIQVEAVLNMRLRALGRLQEEGIRDEFKGLSAEKSELENLLAKQELQWEYVSNEVRNLKKMFMVRGKLSAYGMRRTEVKTISKKTEIPVEALVEKEPVTIQCSAQGWLKTVKGHIHDVSDFKFKEGDGPRFFLHAWTTQSLLVLSASGRVYAISVSDIPSGRGFGQPLNMMIDLKAEDKVSTLQVHEPNEEYIVISSDGRGFKVDAQNLLAQTKSGKQILSPKEGSYAKLLVKLEGDSMALIGQNRKLLIISRDTVPNMSKGQGVILQKYKDGEISDFKGFHYEDGLYWKNGKKNFHETDLRLWLGKRGQAGRMAPVGFSRANKFAF